MAWSHAKPQVEFFSGEPRKVVPFPTPAARTALQWHQLRLEASTRGLPIECQVCEQPYETPPALGRCDCGSYLFGSRRSTSTEANSEHRADVRRMEEGWR